MTFTSLAYTYYRLNENANHQNSILISSAMTGLTIAFGLNVGLLIGVFGIEVWSVVLGIVFSDVFHGVCLRRPQGSKWHEQGPEENEKA